MINLCLGQPKSIIKHFPRHYIQSWKKFKDFSRSYTEIQRNFQDCASPETVLVTYEFYHARRNWAVLVQQYLPFINCLLSFLVRHGSVFLKECLQTWLDVSINGSGRASLRIHPSLFAPRHKGRLTETSCEKSLAARSEEKRLYSQATEEPFGGF